MGKLAVLLFLAAQAIFAQTPKPPSSLTVIKIDPPNWYSALPAPLLLVRGTGFKEAQFRLSDPVLAIQRAVVSDNGHWAQLFLSSAPAQPETVQLTITAHSEHVTVPYTFAAPRRADDGMAGFNPLDVIYLIMTDRFADGDLTNDGPDAQSSATAPEAAAQRAIPRGWHGGDLHGVLEHLDYLQELGISTVWITPVYVNAEQGSYHGYGATDLYGVDPHFGTLADLTTLANALHARRMKLVLDTVPNHVGPAHPWATDEPTPAWFHGTAANHLRAETGFRALINPHAPERDREATLHGWFANILPDMDTDDPAVAQYLRQNAVWWIEQTGADGLRIDTFSYVNRGFWNGFNGELKALFPHVTEVGEIFNGDPTITSAFAGGNTNAGEDTRLYTPFDFPTYFAIRDVFAKGAPMAKLADVLASDALYPHPERLVPFAGNHDTSRLAEEVSSPALRELAFDFLLTTRGTPQIYSGDELAMRGGGDPEDRHDFPGGFPGGSPGGSPEGSPGTAASAFRAGGRTPEQSTMFRTVQQLLTLRREHPTLACGAEQVLATGPDTLVIGRYGSSGCEDAIAAGTPERLVVLLERGTLTTMQVNLKQTAFADCRTGDTLAGKAQVTLEAARMTLTPQTAFVVLRCR